MNRKRLTIAVVAVALAVAGTAWAQEASWIHIRVDEKDGAKVNVNLPMSLVEVAMDIAQREAFDEEHGFARGHMRMGRHHDIDLADLRRMWDELRAAGDAEYVNVTDDDEKVRIYREGDTVFIQVDEGESEKVRVQVPFSVVDTLLEGEGDQLNLLGAVREMARANNGEIIQVNDGETTVRIWIDNNSQG